jgi:hypothetical protein
MRVRHGASKKMGDSTKRSSSSLSMSSRRMLLRSYIWHTAFPRVLVLVQGSCTPQFSRHARRTDEGHSQGSNETPTRTGSAKAFQVATRTSLWSLSARSTASRFSVGRRRLLRPWTDGHPSSTHRIPVGIDWPLSIHYDMDRPRASGDDVVRVGPVPVAVAGARTAPRLAHGRWLRPVRRDSARATE